MELETLTKMVDKFIHDHGGYWDIPWLLAGITEELGELSHSLQQFVGVREKTSPRHETVLKTSVIEECGDLFFSFICLTNVLDINLEKALLDTLKKFSSRK